MLDALIANTRTGCGLLSRGVFRDDQYRDTPSGYVLHEWHADIGAIDAPEFTAAGSTRKTDNIGGTITSIAFRY